MKRILSILLSVSIVASMLVSMSVTSFAVTEGYPEKISFKTTIEKLSDEDVAYWEGEFGESFAGKSLFMVYSTFYNIGTLSCSTYRTNNPKKYVRDLGINNYSVRYLTETPMYGFYLMSNDINAYNGEEITDTITIDQNSEYIYGENECGSAMSASLNAQYALPAAVKTLENAKVEFSYLAISETDTFTLTVDDAYLQLMKSASTSVSSEQIYVTEEKIQGNYAITEVDEPVVYVKNGEQVSKEDYEGGGEPATHAFKVYGYDNAVLEDTTIAEEEAITMPTAPTVDGFEFKGWATEPDGSIVTPATVMGTEDLTYYAVYEEIPDAVEITNVATNNKNVFPGTTSPTTTVMVGESEVTLDITALHRVDTTFNYTGTLEEMGMLFIPKAVADKNNLTTAQNIADSGLAADANCSELPEDIKGVNTDVTFKAGLYNVPAEYKGIDIYAVPYYTLSGGTRQYYTVQTTKF